MLLPLVLSVLSTAGIVRERASLLVDGVREEWSLVWRQAPTKVCGPEDPDSRTCPCSGFAYGESGKLDLIRTRPGREPDSLSLDTLFESDLGPPDAGNLSVLPRKPSLDEDDPDDTTLPFRVAARQDVPILRFLDVDHDGRATEFLLQVGTMPCGKRLTVAVGISRSNPRLHAFVSRHAPERPLTLWPGQWDRLAREPGPFKSLDWGCEDHGSEEETILTLSARKGVITVEAAKWDCEPGPRRKLLRREER
jgi:hypothetical protein